jgi:hypothetical protein
MESFTWRYMSRFQCTGGACEDTCCASWGVEVSERDVSAIQTWLADTPERFAAAILTYPPEHRTPERFGRIRMQRGTRCPLLGSDGLCGVHASLGEAALPMTCTSYPRSLGVRGDGGQELSGFLSCPEVVRQLLEHDDALERDPGAPTHRMNRDQEHPRSGPYVELLDEVRQFVASLGAGLPLGARLWVQHRFAASSVAHFNRNATDTTPIRALMVQFADPEFLAGVIAVQPGPHAALEALLLAQIAQMASSTGQYQKPQALLLQALAHHGDPADLEAVLAGHRAARADWTASAALDRYVAHHWLTRWYTNGPDLSYHAEWLLLKLALLRLLLVSGADPVAAIYSVDRIVEHHGWIYECKGALRQLRLSNDTLAGALIAF